MAVCVLCLHLRVPWAGLQSVFVASPGHTDVPFSKPVLDEMGVVVLILLNGFNETELLSSFHDGLQLAVPFKDVKTET